MALRPSLAHLQTPQLVRSNVTVAPCLVVATGDRGVLREFFCRHELAASKSVGIAVVPRF